MYSVGGGVEADESEKSWRVGGVVERCGDSDS